MNHTTPGQFNLFIFSLVDEYIYIYIEKEMGSNINNICDSVGLLVHQSTTSLQIMGN
jgi:hypothetical protein